MNIKPHRALLATLALGLLTLSACGGSDSDAAASTEPTFVPLSLTVAHINDHHSQLDAFAATTLTLAGTATQVDLGGQVPTWLANLVSTKAPLVTLQGIKNRLPQPAYQVRAVKDLSAHLFDGPPPVLPADHLKAQGS